MPLLFVVLAGICFFLQQYPFIVFLAIGVAWAQVVSLGIAGAVRKAQGYAISDAQKRGVASASLVLWLGFSAVLGAFGLGLYWWLGEMDWPYMVTGGALWLFAALGVNLCLASGRRVMGCIALGFIAAGFLASALFTQGRMQLLTAALSLGIPGLMAWIAAGGLGKFSKADVSRLWAYGRPSWFAWFFGGLPLALAAWWEPTVILIYLLSAAWMDYAVSFGRLDDQGSERHLALSVLVFSIPLIVAPWVRVWLHMPEWFMLMPLWAVSIAHIPVIEGRIARYAWVATLFLALAAGACFLPLPQGGIIAPVLVVVLLAVLRPCIYALWLPVRAKFVHKKRRKIRPPHAG